MSKSHIYSLIGATLLLIAGLTGTLVMSMLMAGQNITLTRVLWVAVSLLLSYVAIKWILTISKNIRQASMDKLLSEQEFITKWTCPKEQWIPFVASQYQRVKKDARNYGVLLGLIVGGIIFFIARADTSNFISFFAALGSGGLFGLIIFILFSWAGRNKQRRLLKHQDGAIVFSKSAFLLNDFLVDWSQPYVSFKSAKLDESLKIPSVVITIEQDAGSASSSYDHYVPIPEGKMDEAIKLIEFYNGQVLPKL
jgi:hypothetical protein